MSMTIAEAIKQLDGADAMLFNRNMKAFNEAIIMAIVALQEKAEREDPKPLTIEELRNMDGEPVYVSDLRRPQNSEYCIIRADEPFVDKYSCAQIAGCECDWYDFDQYGDRWIAYRHKPKEAQG